MKTAHKLAPSRRQAQYALHDILTARSCGACQACCTVVAVLEVINKPEYTRCVHQCDSGCAIYDKRPNACRHYYCFWRMADLPPSIDFRPDRLRVIFDLEYFIVKIDDDVKPKQLPYIRCWQLDGPTQILEQDTIRLIAHTLATKYNFPVVAYYGKEYRAIHLISSLLRWYKPFRRHVIFKNMPIYHLTADLPAPGPLTDDQDQDY